MQMGDKLGERSPLKGNVGKPPASSTLTGYALTFAIAALASGESWATGIVSTSGSISRHTQSLVTSMAATAIMYACCLAGNLKVGSYDSKTMASMLMLAVGYWMFLLGFTQCLAFFDSTQYAACATSIGPILAVLLGSLFLSEQAGLIKLIGLVRNVIVVVLVLDPLGTFADGKAHVQPYQDSSTPAPTLKDNHALVLGLTWATVACSGTAFMRMIQRSLKHVPSPVSSFWMYALNTLGWCGVQMGASILQSPMEQVNTPLTLVPAFVWRSAVLAGFFGAFIIAVQAVALRYIDIGTFSNLVSPLFLVLSFFSDLVHKGTLPQAHVLGGVCIAVLGISLDGCLTK